MEEALIKRLRAKEGLASILGRRKGSETGRPLIDLSARPVDDKTLPAVVIYKVSPGVDYDQETRDSLEGPRVQFSIIGKTYAECKLISRQLEKILEQPETIQLFEADTLVATVEFVRGFLDAERDLNAKDLPGGETEFLLGVDFILWFRRSEPA